MRKYPTHMSELSLPETELLFNILNSIKHDREGALLHFLESVEKGFLNKRPG